MHHKSSLSTITEITTYASCTSEARIKSALSGQELDLKVRQFELLLRQPQPLHATPNLNVLWARLMVEELCRLGASTFCVAPGQCPHISFEHHITYATRFKSHVSFMDCCRMFASV
jgi:hypothetical protein